MEAMPDAPGMPPASAQEYFVLYTRAVDRPGGRIQIPPAMALLHHRHVEPSCVHASCAGCFADSNRSAAIATPRSLEIWAPTLQGALALRATLPLFSCVVIAAM